MHLKDLVNDLLDIAKVEKNELPLSFHPTCSQALIEQSLRLIKGMAFEFKVQLDLIPNDHRPQVSVDSRAIKQVMINLLSNAIKHSPKGSVIKIWTETNSDRFIIKIKDQGAGISSEHLAQLGRPYVKFSNGTHGDKFESTGLGLAICHKLINKHGGHLLLESVVGHGTTATFDLPLASSNGIR